MPTKPKECLRDSRNVWRRQPQCARHANCQPSRSAPQTVTRHSTPNRRAPQETMPNSPSAECDKMRRNATECDKMQQKLVPARGRTRARQRRSVLPSFPRRLCACVIPTPTHVISASCPRHSRIPFTSFPRPCTSYPHPPTSFPHPVHVIPASVHVIPASRARHTRIPSTSFPHPVYVIPIPVYVIPIPVYVIPAPTHVIPAKAGIHSAQSDWTYRSESPSPIAARANSRRQTYPQQNATKCGEMRQKSTKIDRNSCPPACARARGNFVPFPFSRHGMRPGGLGIPASCPCHPRISLRHPRAIPVIPVPVYVIPAPCLRHSRTRPRHSRIPSTSFPHPVHVVPFPFTPSRHDGVYVIPASRPRHSLPVHALTPRRRLRHSREGGNPLHPGGLDTPLGVAVSCQQTKPKPGLPNLLHATLVYATILLSIGERRQT